MADSTPSTPTQDSPLLPRANANVNGNGNFVSSPLNPSSLRSRPQSQASMHFPRVASEESQALAASTPGHRGSMLLYRLQGSPASPADVLPPPPNRESMLDSSRSSVFSLSYDSKYPAQHNSRGLVPYAYDPDADGAADDDDDALHDPDDSHVTSTMLPVRGLINVGVLVLLIAGLLCLFIFYPVLSYFRDKARNDAISGNIRVNGTGQATLTFPMPALIDLDTPQSAHSRTGFDNEQYQLVFSDEFNTPNRTFFPGDDPFWEAANLWYWTTADQEWYDPGQVTTRAVDPTVVNTQAGAKSGQAGALSIVMAEIPLNGLPYRSGMLQSWNKFCFTGGYIEISVSLPGPNAETQGYWPGAWTMGNLARAGYGATSDGVWPYSYNSCDVGTFPNQTYANQSGPAAALSSTASRDKYNMELSWLPGQRLSACTCPNSDHPGPSTSVGRGAPEIDILEVEHNKLGTGQVVSQSGQFAPFSADYGYLNSTQDEWDIYTPGLTTPNSYRGSAVQQAVSALTELPTNIFQQSGQQFTTFGFEYYSDPSNPSDGFITWQTAGEPAARLGAAALGPDANTLVGQRLISVEPMSIILNLGISPNWQTIDLTTMIFPAEMLIDYVRVYQRKGAVNVGCSPPAYPTEDYISRHMDMYTNPNWTTWQPTKPVNGLVGVVCRWLLSTR
ncbi:beta-glucan synthesis-associated [Hygrophoropsis aurantiaca]|uniref:Beta-glucan synthesis-associated n=1 Tax=Hygrophoropsis aurantiaca TaxID=72124 RepID=A0ACB7ZZF7_9AGAM|nr:beta-glucan synthesis-associated [Hygrophoropsis aurantiaca]